MDVKALNCPNCGAPVRVGMRYCPYCGSGIRFVGDENLMHVEIVHAKVVPICADMRIDFDLLDHYSEQGIEAYVKYEICKKISRELFDLIAFQAMQDPITRSVTLRGRLRVVHPRSDVTDHTVEIGRIKYYDELQFGTGEYGQ